MAMDRELREHIEVIERNQKTIQNEIVETRNEVLRTHRDLVQRLTELEKRIKKG